MASGKSRTSGLFYDRMKHPKHNQGEGQRDEKSARDGVAVSSARRETKKVLAVRGYRAHYDRRGNQAKPSKRQSRGCVGKSERHSLYYEPRSFPVAVFDLNGLLSSI